MLTLVSVSSKYIKRFYHCPHSYDERLWTTASSASSHKKDPPCCFWNSKKCTPQCKEAQAREDGARTPRLPMLSFMPNVLASSRTHPGQTRSLVACPFRALLGVTVSPDFVFDDFIDRKSACKNKQFLCSLIKANHLHFQFIIWFLSSWWWETKV